MKEEELLIDFISIIAGIFGLYFGGNYLVKGSVGLSLCYGIPPMIVGLTVMAFGTSAPELFVSVRSALSGYGNLAFGNIVGSNIANILLILGVPAIISSLRTDTIDTRIPWFEVMGASLLLWWLVQYDPFTFWQGAVLFTGFLLVIAGQIYRAKRGEVDLSLDVDETTKDHPIHIILAWLLMGLILLPLGGEFLVHGAVDIARSFGLSEAIIGLTIVAIGTSLPELAASIVAAERGETAMAVGNALGSCLFNILLILGITGLLTSSYVDPGIVHVDIPIMILVVALMAVFVFWRVPITRLAGILMVCAYFLYILGLIIS